MNTIPIKTKKRKNPYTTGEINKCIDSIFHPFYKKSDFFRLLDGLAHSVVEDNPKASVKKFVRYNFPELIEKLLKKK